MREVKLGEYCEVVRGSSPRPKGDPRYFGPGVPRLMIADLTRDGKTVRAKIDSLTVEGAQKSRPMRTGDVVIAVSGNPGLPAILAEDLCIHDGFVGLRNLSNDFSSDYVYWFLKAFHNQVGSAAVGAIFKNLTTDQIKKLEIPLPPLPEQKRIAAILDAADALRARRRTALAELDALLQSTFLEMFGDPVTNPMGWEECMIRDVAELGTGSTPSRKNDLHFQGNIPWVKSTEVDWGIVTRTGECVSVAGQKAARLKIYPKGSIILALYGQGKTRGKCAILGLDATINQACCALLPKSNCSTRYLFAFLKHSYSRLRGESRGGNQENLNLSIVRDFPIPLPPIELQTRFAASVESIECQKVRMSAHLTELDALFASLQSRAFNGEL